MSFIDNLPSQIHSVHDIRLRFNIEEIWSTIRNNHPEIIPNEVSKDISLLPVRMHSLEAKIVAHHSDTVSVIVACSMKPVVVDNEGLICLSNILTSVEEKLLALVAGCAHTTHSLPKILISIRSTISIKEKAFLIQICSAPYYKHSLKRDI
jgi:hypothetical protein